MAWLYGPIGAGAFVVLIIVFKLKRFKISCLSFYRVGDVDRTLSPLTNSILYQ